MAKRFAELGAAKIWLVARRQEELERVANLCNCPTEVKMLDLSEYVSCLDFAKSLPEPIDILINNGGISMRDAFIDCELDVMQRLMNVNFMSGVALIKGFLPSFLK